MGRLARERLGSGPARFVVHGGCACTAWRPSTGSSRCAGPRSRSRPASRGG